MEYLLDGKRVSKAQLIEAARAEGYEPEDGEYFTSVAIMVLARSGHKVELADI